MWTGHGKCLRNSIQCSSKDEGERGLAKIGKEYEKVQLVPQKNA